MWLRFALTGSLATLVIHVAVLAVNGQNPVSTPISYLSRHQWGVLHTAGLVLFGLAHVALAVGLGRMDRGRLWPVARALLVAGGAGLVYVAYYYLSAPEAALQSASASTPLWIVASLTGMAMGALQPGLSRQARQLGIFSTVCLGVWLWMVPIFWLVDDAWIGAYERIVGGIYIVWVAGVALGLIRHGSERRANQP